MSLASDLLKKWVDFYGEKNRVLKKIESTRVNFNIPFFKKLNAEYNSIEAKIGLGYSCFNELIIRALAKTIANFFIAHKKNPSDEIDLLVSTDNTKIIFLLKEMAKVLTKFQIKITTFKEFTPYDKKYCCKMTKKLSLSGLIFIETNTYDQSVFNLFVYNQNGEPITEKDFYLNLVMPIEKDYPFQIEIENPKIDYLSNIKTVDEYVTKINAIESRGNDQKKTKIAIANLNAGTLKIVKKIFGKLDYRYYVAKPSKKRKALLVTSDNKVKSYFAREIFYARRKKCNVLLCSFNNSSQLFLFILLKNQIVFLNSNEFSLLFIDTFIANLKRNNIQLNRAYISSDTLLIPQIEKLVRKYKLKHYIQNRPYQIEKQYLLYHWNSSNQFTFGDDKIIEFGFHHLILKMIEIINYFFTQKSNILVERNRLKKIYGISKTICSYENISKEKIVSYFRKVAQTKRVAKFKVEALSFPSNVNPFGEEINLISILFANELNLIILFNRIINKSKFIFYTPNSIQSEFNNLKNHQQKKIIRKIKKAISE